MLNTSQRRVNKNSLTWWYILKTSWRYLCKTPWRYLEDVFKTSWRCLEDFWRRLQNFLKTFLQDVLKTSWKSIEDVLARRLEDFLKTYGQDKHIGLDQDVLKTSWRGMAKTNIFVLTKTSWRRVVDVFIKMNVYWEVVWVYCLILINHHKVMSSNLHFPNGLKDTKYHI